MGGPVDAHGPSPLGTQTNKPLVDRGTNTRSANRPAGKQCDSNPAVNLAFEGTAWALLLGVGAVQDKYAFEIFSLWFLGASDEETFNRPDWAAYMRAEPRLPGEITSELRTLAYGLRRLADTDDEVDAKEIEFITALRSNDPAVGYNRTLKPQSRFKRKRLRS